MTARKHSRWSWRLGNLFGISIRVHVTLFAFLVWIAIAAPIAGAGPIQTLVQAALVIAVFACILVHELAHALVARRYGCTTREILLLPIGGLAQMERVPERPAHELLVAVVGPATNVVLALAFSAIIEAAGWSFGLEQPTLAGAIVVPLFWSNIGLAIFNLLPAFPMDGGRALRAVLAFWLGRTRATRIAGRVGKILAVLFVLAGLALGATMLSIIGLFVWFAADHEASTTALSSGFAGATAADAMIQTTQVVDATASVDDAADRMLAAGQRELLVTEQGRITGIVTAADLSRARGAVGAVMHRDIPVVDPTAPLASVLQPIEEGGVVFVGDGDTIIGMLDAEQLATYATVASGRIQVT